MTKTTIIERDGKPEYAVLEYSEYERLVAAAEDAADIAALATLDGDDTEEDLPDEMVARLLAGDNPIRVWREHRGMTGRRLAESERAVTPSSGERSGERLPHRLHRTK